MSDPTKSNQPGPESSGSPDNFRVKIVLGSGFWWLPGSYTYRDAFAEALRQTVGGHVVEICDEQDNTVATIQTCRVCRGSGRAMNKEAQWETCIWCKGGIVRS